MPDQPTATPVNMPVANGATPESGFHAGGNFHEFRQRAESQAKAAQAAKAAQQQQAPKPQTPAQQVAQVSPTHKTLGEAQQAAQQPKIDAPPEGTDGSTVPAETAGEIPPEGAVADPNTDPNAPPQVTPEQLEKLKLLQEWESSDTLPLDVARKLFGEKLIPLPNGDQVEYETWEEVVNGRLRQKDHMRGIQQRDQERAQEQHIRKGYEEHFQAISNLDDIPSSANTMYEVYTRQGMRPILMAVAEKLAQEEQEDRDHAHGYAIAFAKRNGIQDWNHYDVQKALNQALEQRRAFREQQDRGKRDQFEIERLRALQQQKVDEGQREQHFEVQRRQLAQLRPVAFAKVGLDHNNDLHRMKFDEWMAAAIHTTKAKALTPELVMRAARAAAEDLRDQKGGAPPQQRRPAQPFVPKLGVGGGGSRQAPQTEQRLHAGNFLERHNMDPWKKR